MRGRCPMVRVTRRRALFGASCETTSRHRSGPRVCGELGWPHGPAPGRRFGATASGLRRGSGRRGPACAPRSWLGRFTSRDPCNQVLAVPRATHKKQPSPVGLRSLGSARVRDETNRRSGPTTRVELSGKTLACGDPFPFPLMS